LLWLRLPLQAMLVAWVRRATRPAAAAVSTSSTVTYDAQ